MSKFNNEDLAKLFEAYSDTERHRVHDIHEFGLDCKNFIIYLHSVEEGIGIDDGQPGIEYRVANKFVKNLDILTGIDTEQPIIISMKVCGGDWEEGMAMYDAIMATPNPVTIVNYTHAESMASIILQAANKRVMMPHSYFMFHEGYLTLSGTAKQVRSEQEYVKSGDNILRQVYTDALKRSEGKCSSWSKKRIVEWLNQQMNDKEEVYMQADEAIKWGFADELFSDWDSVTDYTEAQLAWK